MQTTKSTLRETHMGLFRKEKKPGAHEQIGSVEVTGEGTRKEGEKKRGEEKNVYLSKTILKRNIRPLF